MKRSIISTVCSMVLASSLIVSAGAVCVPSEQGPVERPGIILSKEDGAPSLPIDSSPEVGVDNGYAASTEEAAPTADGTILEEEVTDEEMDRVLKEDLARSSTKLWNNITLSGDSLSKAIPLENGNHYFKVWVKNSGTQNIIITFTSGSPTGPTLTTGIKTLAPGKSMSYYTAEHQPLYGSLYYANFTSGKADMAGVAACRVASTYAELDL